MRTRRMTAVHLPVEPTESAAAGSRARMLDLAERMSGVGRWRFDLATQRVEWSDEVYRIHGVTPETYDPNLADAIEFYHEDDQAEVRAFVQAIIADGQERSFQLRLRRPDGDLRDVVSRASRDVDDESRPTAVFGVFQDVTHHSRALAAAKRSERRYQLLADNMGDVVVRLRPDGSSSYISPAITTLLGYAAEDMTGRAAQDFLHPDDQGRLLAVLSEVAGGAGQGRARLRALRKDGSAVPVEVTFRRVAGEDRPEIIAVIRDISEREALERALRDSEAQYRILAEHSTDAINQTNLASDILYVSPAIQQLAGYAPAELIGSKAYDLVDPEDWPRVRREYAKLVHFGREARMEPIQYRMVRADGTRVWVEISPRVVWEDEVPVGFVDVVRDISARKAAEEELRQARREAEAAAGAKADFLANMSHELRTPLTSILGFGQLAAGHTDLTPSLRNCIEKIEGAGRALLATVNDILDFSELEAGQLMFAPVPVDVRALLAESLDLLSPQAGAKDLDLALDIDDAMPSHLRIDPDRVRQILLNYLSNAVKFTPAGSVTLAARYDTYREALCVEVSDTGAGIAADKLDRLFVRFSQVDGGLARASGGTGLGLAICKGLAEAMGGCVGVKTTEGEGSRFWFEIAARPTEAITDRTSPTVGDCGGRLAGARVLVVDDNPSNRSVARAMLEACGCLIDQAADGDEALALSAKRPYDVVLLDLRMPGKDGYQTLTALRARPGPNQTIPVVAFTADAAPIHSELVAAGFDAVAEKPVVLADLVSTLATALDYTRETPLDRCA